MAATKTMAQPKKMPSPVFPLIKYKTEAAKSSTTMGSLTKVFKASKNRFLF